MDNIFSELRWIQLGEMKKYDLPKRLRDFFRKNKQKLEKLDSFPEEKYVLKVKLYPTTMSIVRVGSGIVSTTRSIAIEKTK